MKPAPISVVHKTSWVEVQARLKGLDRYRIELGIFGGSKAGRQKAIRDRVKKLPLTKKGKKKKKLFQESALSVAMNNAQLLYTFEKGSPIRNQPPRPVLEPSLRDLKNKEEVSKIFYSAAQDVLNGNRYRARQKLQRAAGVAKKNAQKWFDNPNNNWAPNAPSTIRHKGFDKPGIETEVMKESIDARLQIVPGNPSGLPTSSSPPPKNVTKVQTKPTPVSGTSSASKLLEAEGGII